MQIIATLVFIIAAILCVSSFKDERKRSANLAACLFFYGVYVLRAIRRRKRELRPSGQRGVDSFFLSLRLLFSRFISGATIFKIQNLLKFYRGLLWAIKLAPEHKILSSMKSKSGVFGYGI